MQGFERQLGLPGTTDLGEVTRAVVAEQRRAAQSVKLRATDVIDHGGGLYELRVSGFPNLDWTWEGAAAFRPADIDGPGDDETSHLWKGEVVGLEPDESALYVAVGSTSERGPCQGSFIVRPFDYLAVLRDLLTASDLGNAAGALAAALANAETLDAGTAESVAPAQSGPLALRHYAWSLLWGPPGTGKTYRVGEIVSRSVSANERILVVATTNKAADSAAIQVGRWLRELGKPIAQAVRLGSGADIERYEAEGLDDLVNRGETQIRRDIARTKRELRRCTDTVEQARLQHRLVDLQRMFREAGQLFLSEEIRIVICTAYSAMARLVTQDVRRLVAAGRAPFTTIVLDEAGLLSRAVTGALSLLGARHVLLVGDPRQLAPISRMSRILPPSEARWLGSSGLTSVTDLHTAWPNIHQLTEQHRMAPPIREVVSRYQYDGRLVDAAAVVRRVDPRGSRLGLQPRAIWYVLDDDPGEHVAHIRAERGPGNRSWVRPRTWEILDRLLRGHPEMVQGGGLFISPFAAQARAIRRSLADAGYSNWTASTVHAQQGAEADYVVFDTVHAGSTGWPFDEWKRLVNVAISRAREQLIVFASRAEMQEPYLSELADLLAPRTFSRGGWHASERTVVHRPSFEARRDAQSLGAQLERRKALRPVMSAEQERLCAYSMDGKPRLVRGVAGSGKTYVLAHWLARTVGDPEFRGKAWVLYANAALKTLLERTALEAWDDRRGVGPFPHDRVVFMHIRDLLESLARQVGLRILQAQAFDYDAIARAYLQRVPRDQVRALCDALFIDEAQDFGPHTLELCFALVKAGPESADQKPAMVFYDNAQNVYGRGTPTWSHLGLNMTGRSTVMKESFRSTWPINEFALNVLFRLHDPANDADHREMIRAGLVREEERHGRPWWRIHFNRVDGPLPRFRQFQDREREIEAAASHVEQWISGDGISPRDIKVLCNGSVRNAVVSEFDRRLRRLNVKVAHQTGQTFIEQDDTLVVSTAHSFKGYESEAIVVPCADRFSTKSGAVLGSALYVAMTRARSLLYVSAIERRGNGPERAVVEALKDVDLLLRGALPMEAVALEGSDATAELAGLVDAGKAAWVLELAKRTKLVQEPILDEDGAIVAEPRFWFEHEGARYAYFDEPPVGAAAHDVEDAGIVVMREGQIPI